MNASAQAVVEELHLLPHPEGGFYRETFRASRMVPTAQGERSASTAIYFLLAAGTFSALHRVRSDEMWHHYAGDAVEIHLLDERTGHTTTRLGGDLAAGERPQLVVPAGVWQAAVPLGERFALCGCTVAPGFDFADFEMPSRGDLLKEWPALRDVIERLTRA